MLYNINANTTFHTPKPIFELLINNDIIKFHNCLPNFQPSPLTALPNLAKSLELGNIFVKDESKRLHLKAFKVLGASWAIYRYISEQYFMKTGQELKPYDFLKPEIINKAGKFTFCTATDGNHGRAVAWTANTLGQKSVIFMPENSVQSRIDNIIKEGAELRLIKGNFDECVAEADKEANKNGWVLISDTAYGNYTKIPTDVMSGYYTLFMEIFQQIPEVPDIVLLQAGVGAMAACGAVCLTHAFADKLPQIVVVEPIEADAFLQSALAGSPQPSKGSYQSIMAGLNCGASSVAWPILSSHAKAFMAIPDNYAKIAMRKYYYSQKDDASVVSGESGAAGLAGLIALCTDERYAGLKTALHINPNTKVLLINTEGDTDPENFAAIINSNEEPQ